MITPNGKKIEDYISELKLDRNNIEVSFIQHKMFEKKEVKIKNKNKRQIKPVTPISNRLLPNILKGQKTKKSNLDALAALFTKINKSNGNNRIVSTIDLVDEKNLDPENSLRLIRTYKDLLDSGDKAFDFIPFFHIDINKDTEPKINNLLESIENITGYGSDPAFKSKIEYRTKLTEYKHELKIISEVNTTLNELSKKNIFLYVGDLTNVPELYTYPKLITEHVKNHPDSSYNIDKQKVETNVQVIMKSYKILRFTNQNLGGFITAKYKPAYRKDELENMLKKLTTKATEEVKLSKEESQGSEVEPPLSDFAIENKYADLAENNFLLETKTKLSSVNFISSFKFERSRLEFNRSSVLKKFEYYKKGDDPLFDNYLEENDLTYEEAMDIEEDQHAEMQLNYLRGKWF